MKLHQNILSHSCSFARDLKLLQISLKGHKIGTSISQQQIYKSQYIWKKSTQYNLSLQENELKPQEDFNIHSPEQFELRKLSVLKMGKEVD